MRQIGVLPNQIQAERFIAFLTTQGVSAQAEPEEDSWAIWVRDEDHLEQAKDALVRFRSNPDDPRYASALREARAILDAEQRRREEASKNVIEMRRQWRRPGTRRTPLVTATILLCIVVFLLAGLGANPASTAMRTLAFCDPAHAIASERWDPERLSDRLIDIRRGQVWRLVTPVFLHAGIMHLAFNMFMFHMFGSMIEDRRGTVRLALIMLVVALLSNLAQGLAPSEWGRFGGGPNFMGISGVVYGLLGYLWMKSTFEPELGLYISNGMVAFLVVWMLLGFAGALEPLGIRMANLAHGVGFLVGLAIGYAPQLVRRGMP